MIVAARDVWQECLQLHGAIGMTQEYVLGQYFKRLALACTLYGALEQQLERLAAISLDKPSAEGDLAPGWSMPEDDHK